MQGQPLGTVLLGVQLLWQYGGALWRDVSGPLWRLQRVQEARQAFFEPNTCDLEDRRIFTHRLSQAPHGLTKR